MKLLFVAVFIVALSQVRSLTDKQKELLAQHYNECINKSQVDKAILQKARLGEFADNEKLKTHILCISEKIGFQGPDGKLRKDVIQMKLNEALSGDTARTQNVINACAISNTDRKLQAFKAFKCVHEKAGINLL